MQAKYKRHYRRNPDREISEGKKRREETVNTKYFRNKQKFGPASKVRHISVEEYLSSAS